MNMQTSEGRRTRNEYGERASRTYYAINEKRDTLYRFTNHTNREEAIEAESLMPLGALEFRNLRAADVEGKLRIVEQRRSGKLTVVAEPRKRGPGRPRKVAVEARRGPGRPRKTAAVASEQPVRRGPGRPRKVVVAETGNAPTVATGTQQIMLTPESAMLLGTTIARELMPQLNAVLNAGKAASATAQTAGVPNQGQ